MDTNSFSEFLVATGPIFGVRKGWEPHHGPSFFGAFRATDGRLGVATICPRLLFAAGRRTLYYSGGEILQRAMHKFGIFSMDRRLWKILRGRLDHFRYVRSSDAANQFQRFIEAG